ncbi:OLC1v1036985C1 [Oldenlandia corymbosa var. corymbosa]|uniref:OLC1v1036985C1 n=1 Tax=Oldenlandia corymbosa var. corymbosa TaxID=529605 RepID=A0AAV1CZT2_OLDCO|nr:OLC1v1036985C1 [Oldenlandia corymbosa var. corymbosa]
MLNAEKMSKSAGNFRTLREAIQEFSADATRFALADAGDGLDDANFVFETANSAILRLTKETAWIKEFFSPEAFLRSGEPSTFADLVFDNEINMAAVRDEYRLSCDPGGMNRELVSRFIDVQTRLIAPISGNLYLQNSIASMRKLLQKQVSGTKKGNANRSNSLDKPKVVGLIFIKEHYDGWKKECLIIPQKFNSESREFAPDDKIRAAVGPDRLQLCMPFLRLKKDEALAVGEQALHFRLPFNEIEVLEKNSDLIARQLDLKQGEIFSADDPVGVERAGDHASRLKEKIHPLRGIQLQYFSSEKSAEGCNDLGFYSGGGT